MPAFHTLTRMLAVAALLSAGCVSAPNRTQSGHPANPAVAATPTPAASATLGASGFGVLFAPKADAHEAHQHHAPAVDAQSPAAAPPPVPPAPDPTASPAAPQFAAPVEAAPRESKPARKPKKAAALYVCPMHPDVTSATPGTCPKCHMQLERRTP